MSDYRMVYVEIIKQTEAAIYVYQPKCERYYPQWK